ncbi:hypothetical protein [Glycomyces algeriensis]|uniref:Winged helix DNA-binding protein n=1 Tax=Glycomyces algeriensis TaxID=256037 RepID=A0A9W6G9A8_9ACTN|nr:hypothetical protein [Glycomyces algeriensis]MDA1365086.1 hypothetical protein [Glycomyces algeriensis]MDR7349852.1 hypothetical protein [Glycomyces algeriensis]GLI42563.1 hypothetical protein GALLR39Z86_24130 [Glycomyces algeriensis]
MNELRESILSVGVADPETAVSVHALLGSDPDLLALAGDLPQRRSAVDAWVKTMFLRPEGPFLEIAASAVEDALGEAPDKAVDETLAAITTRPRTPYDLRAVTGLAEADLDVLLPHLEAAGLVRADANPLDPEAPFWTMDHRFARFHYAMLAEHLPRWRRGYITDKLWRMTHARYDRYVCRPEFHRLAREWALNDPAAAQTTRVTVPDPRFRQLRTIELAAWNAAGEPIALGTIRWKFQMVERQLKRLRYVKRLLGDPKARLYCIAPRVEAAITADPDPDLFVIGPAQLLRRGANESANAPETAPNGDLHPISRLVGAQTRRVG